LKKKFICGTLTALLLSIGVVANAASFVDGLNAVDFDIWKTYSGSTFYSNASADVYSWEYGTPVYHYQRAQSVVTITGAVRSDSGRVYSRGYGVATTPSAVKNEISFSSKGFWGY